MFDNPGSKIKSLACALFAVCAIIASIIFASRAFQMLTKTPSASSSSASVLDESYLSDSRLTARKQLEIKNALDYDFETAQLLYDAYTANNYYLESDNEPLSFGFLALVYCASILASYIFCLLLYGYGELIENSKKEEPQVVSHRRKHRRRRSEEKDWSLPEESLPEE